MKRIRNMCKVFVLILTMVVGMQMNVSAATVKINKTNITVTKGYTYKLKVKGTNKKITWKSGNTKVATVNQKGVVKGVKKGRTTITAKVKGGKTYKCKVTVVNNQYISTVKPSTVRVRGNGVNLQVQKIYYSGGKLVAKGFFTNRTGRPVYGLRNYRICLYGTKANGKKTLLADGAFNMNVNIQNNGYQYTKLTFAGDAVKGKKNLCKFKGSSVLEGGILLY